MSILQSDDDDAYVSLPLSKLPQRYRRSARRAQSNSVLKFREAAEHDGTSRVRPTLPHVAWLDRPHPCPDIEDRIRYLQAHREP